MTAELESATRILIRFYKVPKMTLYDVDIPQIWVKWVKT